MWKLSSILWWWNLAFSTMRNDIIRLQCDSNMFTLKINVERCFIAGNLQLKAIERNWMLFHASLDFINYLITQILPKTVQLQISINYVQDQIN